ncbi:MAG: phenylacetate--CoA ligase family protein, partial [Pseudomonadota bacterium]
MRIKGWMGRADQTTKVKGMFVRPEQMAEIAKRIPQIARLRLSVSRVGEQDAMTLSVEPNPGVALETETIAGTLQDVTKLKGSVVIAQQGSLPNDGKVISDDREL